MEPYLFHQSHASSQFTNTLLVSVIVGFAIVLLLGVAFPPIEPALTWSSPLFEPFFRSLDSGPPPEAGACALGVDAAILAVPIYIGFSRLAKWWS